MEHCAHAALAARAAYRQLSQAAQAFVGFYLLFFLWLGFSGSFVSRARPAYSDPSLALERTFYLLTTIYIFLLIAPFGAFGGSSLGADSFDRSKLRAYPLRAAPIFSAFSLARLFDLTVIFWLLFFGPTLFRSARELGLGLGALGLLGLGLVLIILQAGSLGQLLYSWLESRLAVSGHSGYLSFISLLGVAVGPARPVVRDDL